MVMVSRVRYQREMMADWDEGQATSLAAIQ